MGGSIRRGKRIALFGIRGRMGNEDEEKESGRMGVKEEGKG